MSICLISNTRRLCKDSGRSILLNLTSRKAHEHTFVLSALQVRKRQRVRKDFQRSSTAWDRIIHDREGQHTTLITLQTCPGEIYLHLGSTLWSNIYIGRNIYSYAGQFFLEGVLYGKRIFHIIGCCSLRHDETSDLSLNYCITALTFQTADFTYPGNTGRRSASL